MNQKDEAEAILEAAEKEAGTQAIQAVADEHLLCLMGIRQQLALSDIELVTSAITKNSQLDHAVKNEIGSLHKKIASIVHEVARNIESEKYLNAEQAIADMQLSRVQHEKISKLVGADKELHVSCQSLKIAVEIFCGINKEIVSRLEDRRVASVRDERNLVLGNALLVYELTDFTIQFIENFKLLGIQSIESLHEYMLKSISALRDEQSLLAKQAESDDIEHFLREQVRNDIENRESSILIMEQEWASYMKNVTGLTKEIESIRGKLPSLRLIRDNAKAQINTLAVVAVLQIVQSNIRAIEGAVLQLDKLQLVSLSADRVRRLLGI